MDLTTKRDANLAQQTIKGKKLTLRDMKRANNLPTRGDSYIVADISGSMSGDKLTALKDALGKVYQPGIKVYAFSDEVYELQQSDFPGLRTMGGTAMLLALNETWNHSPRHIILITDGQPTDANEDSILSAASRHTDVPIDTIGISNYGRRGFNSAFLEELSRITGGKFNDCSRPFELTAVIQNLLLTAGQAKERSVQL